MYYILQVHNCQHCFMSSKLSVQSQVTALPSELGSKRKSGNQFSNHLRSYNLKKLAQQILIAPDRNVYTFVYVIRISAFKKTDTVISE